MDDLEEELDALDCILCGQKEPDSLDFRLLQRLTRNFSDDRRIGEGGCGEVYKGELPNGKLIAVKKLKRDHIIDERMFLREVDSMVKVRHQNIVRFLGYCSEIKEKAVLMDGKIVMAEEREKLLCFPYICNGSLDKHLMDELRGFEWHTRYQIIKGICDGLLHLHKEKGIMHMDLKPANILLGDQMVPKITDFGASRIDGKTQITSAERLFSRGHAAPEYIDTGVRSWKSDIYSLGVIMIELVTGSRKIPNTTKVLRRWRHRWNTSSKHTPLSYQQVKKCLELAVSCKEINPVNRPFIWDVVRELNELGSWDGQITESSLEKIISSSDDMLGIEPLELYFPLAHEKQVSCSVELTNGTDYYMAFRIATTSLLPFSIQPDKGIAAPGSMCRITIILPAQEMARLKNHREGFIVQSTRVDGGLTAVDIIDNTFTVEGGYSQKKNDDGDKVVDEVTLTVLFDMLHEEHQDQANLSAEMGSVVTSSQEVQRSTNLFPHQDYEDPRPMDPVAFARERPSDSDRTVNEDKRFMSCSMPWEHQKLFDVPVSSFRELHLQSDEPSTSEANCSRGRMISEDLFAPRTSSLSPVPKGHAFVVSNGNSREFGFSLRSLVRKMDGLRNPPHPLPLPPASAACFPLHPASAACSPLPSSPSWCPPLPASPTMFSQSQSQWKKGKLLGSGTFGQVYLGFNSGNGQFCAIKEVQVIMDYPHSKQQLKHLNQEIDMLRQLSHPNIVQYHGSELSDEALSIYLEYVSGGSIHKLLREYGPFKEPVIRNYTGQILAGLAYLHGRNTVHRDIKGPNILVGPNGEVKLADFGMAKHMSSFAFKGSPYWMAPEAIMDSKGYSLSVDIWSLGCTIIEMATARPPWHQYEGAAAIFKIANSKDIPEIPDSFSEEGKSFLQLCLKRDPASRPSAARLMDHPFVQDHPAVRAAKSSVLRNALSSPADGRHAMSNRELPSRKIITPLKDIGLSMGYFTGFPTAVVSPHSSPIVGSANMSMLVSPCSIPLRQFKQSNVRCMGSPPHPMLSPGLGNTLNYTQNQTRHIPAPVISDPWLDVGQMKLQSPNMSPKKVMTSENDV